MASSLDGPVRLVCFSNHPPSSPFHGYLATSTFNRVTVYDVKSDRVVRRFSAIDAIAGMAFNPYTADCEADDARTGAKAPAATTPSAAMASTQHAPAHGTRRRGRYRRLL
jgi:hypothetical protein